MKRFFVNNKIVCCLSLGIMFSLTASKPGEKESISAIVCKNKGLERTYHIQSTSDFSVNQQNTTINQEKATSSSFATVWAEEVYISTSENGNKSIEIKGSSSENSGLNYELSFVPGLSKELQNFYYAHQKENSSYFDFGKLLAAKQDPKKGDDRFYLSLIHRQDQTANHIVLHFTEQQIQELTGITYYYKPARIAALSLSALEIG